MPVAPPVVSEPVASVIEVPGDYTHTLQPLQSVYPPPEPPEHDSLQHQPPNPAPDQSEQQHVEETSQQEIQPLEPQPADSNAFSVYNTNLSTTQTFMSL